MALNIRITATNLTDVIRGLNRTRDQLGDLTPFWRTMVVPVLQDKIRDIFLQEGPGWEELAPSTLQTRMYPEKPILEQTGALMESVIDNPIIVATRRQLLYGTTNPYARYHEDGTSKMPARPFIRPARQEIIDEIVEKFRIYIQRGR